MFKLTRVAASLLVAALVSGGSIGTSTAAPDAIGETTPDASRAVAKRGVVVATSAKQVNEGDRFTLTASIKSARQAFKVTLQKWEPPLYSGDDTDWNSSKTKKVRKAKVRFPVVATDANVERYRVVVTYEKTKRPVVSKPVVVTVWRWIPMKEYDPYYESEPYAMGFGTTSINGHVYAGWGPYSYSHTGTWEARFTPGRHCKMFRAVLGVGDLSADGSSGVAEFTADDKTIYQTPALRPGMSVPVAVPLAKPYRFGVQLFDTTPGGTTGHDDIEAWPVLGEPAFLCTGV